jgi:hypothetical protein
MLLPCPLLCPMPSRRVWHGSSAHVGTFEMGGATREASMSRGGTAKSARKGSFRKYNSAIWGCAKNAPLESTNSNQGSLPVRMGWPWKVWSFQTLLRRRRVWRLRHQLRSHQLRHGGTPLHQLLILPPTRQCRPLCRSRPRLEPSRRHHNQHNGRRRPRRYQFRPRRSGLSPQGAPLGSSASSFYLPVSRRFNATGATSVRSRSHLTSTNARDAHPGVTSR